MPIQDADRLGAESTERRRERHTSTVYYPNEERRGIPPVVTNEPADCYVGYFENRSGEQRLFTFNRATRAAILRSGDAGWNSAHDVHDGRVDGLILAPEEAAWLHACWSAVRA